MPLSHVGQNLPTAFRTYRLASARNVPVTATGDVLINGVTPTLFTNASLFTIESILIWNPRVNGVSGDITATTAPVVSVWTGAGGTGTQIVNGVTVTITQVAGTNGVQALTLAVAATTTLQGPTGLWLNIGTAAATAGSTMNIAVFGQVLLD